MKMSDDIDREFYETFAAKCRAREGIVRRGLLDRAAGKLDETEARHSLSAELHDLAGEAAMLGLGPISAPTSRITHALRDEGPLSAEFWDNLGDWVHQINAGAAELLAGNDPTEALQALDIEVAAALV